MTGNSLCPDCADKKQDYLALVEVDPSKSVIRGNVLHQENAHRTGNIAHVKRRRVGDIIPGIDPNLLMVFIEPGVIEKLMSMQEKPE